MFHSSVFKNISLFAVFAFLTLYAWLGGYFAKEIITSIAILSIVAVSLDFVAGYGGMISLCHGAIYGLGAYMYAISDKLLGLDPFLSIVIAVAICFVFSAFIGAITSRTHGIFFIMSTLAFGQMAYVLIFDSKALGGDDGMAGISRMDLSFLGIDLNGSMQYALLCLTVLLLVYFLLAFLLRSSFGQTLVGVRENEERMRALGVSIVKIKTIAFGISGACTALAGCLVAQHIMFVSPELLFWTVSGEILIITILGGLGTLVGPIVGAITLIMAKHSLSDYTDHWHLIVGIVLIVVVLANGRGIFGELQRQYNRLANQKQEK